MDTATAQNYLEQFLETNPNLKPSDGFKLSEPAEHSVQGDTFYSFWWVEESGQNARGGYTYYVFSDGSVLAPGGGSGNPESAEDVWARWHSK